MNPISLLVAASLLAPLAPRVDCALELATPREVETIDVILEVPSTKCANEVLSKFVRVPRVIGLDEDAALIAGRVKAESLEQLKTNACVIRWAPEGRLRVIR